MAGHAVTTIACIAQREKGATEARKVEPPAILPEAFLASHSEPKG